MTKFRLAWMVRAFSIAILSACCSSELNSKLFLDPAKHVGERVAMRGYLHWRFEDRSLYPSEREAADDRLCVPVLIRSKHKELIEDAKRRDGSTVEISGKLV